MAPLFGVAGRAWSYGETSWGDGAGIPLPGFPCNLGVVAPLLGDQVV